MIDFPCKCGFGFSVPDGLAGGTIQCPECGLLADIPTLSDRASILPDGTYMLDAPEPAPPEHFAKILHAFNRNTLDTRGNVKDLRVTMDDIERVGVHEPASSGPAPKAAPRYDPETGELIRPLGVAPREQDGSDIPVAKAALSYALPGLSPRVSPGGVFLELLAPPNILVMGFIMIFHMMLQMTILTLSILFPVVGFLFLAMLIIAHYGCVIEDIGREEIDELPRPLRSVSLTDDLWWPFCNVMGAFIVSYAPVLIAMLYLQPHTLAMHFATGSLLMFGTIIMPAILLTMLTSGTVANLRPDRVLGVIRAAGGNYALLALEWAAAISLYVTGVYGFNFCCTISLLDKSGYHVSKRTWTASMLMLVLGVYLMHAFCWHLGQMYRGKHPMFPWALQRHVRTPKTVRQVKRRTFD